jgi:hypothetical protein
MVVAISGAITIFPVILMGLDDAVVLRKTFCNIS